MPNLVGVGQSVWASAGPKNSGNAWPRPLKMGRIWPITIYTPIPHVLPRSGHTLWA